MVYRMKTEMEAPSLSELTSILFNMELNHLGMKPPNSFNKCL